jgi:glyoxylase-like metal-dependent hydrolase (beta-lactamase superfamily II)
MEHETAGSKNTVRLMMSVREVDARITLFIFDELRTSWLVRDRSNILIESGFPSNASELLTGLEKVSLRPLEIDFLALTHIHLDHAGGAGHIARENPDLKVFVHAKGARHLRDPEKLMKSVKSAYKNDFSSAGDMIPIPERQIVTVTSGDVIDLGDTQLDVLYTPGHAKHHVVYFDRASESVFSGDALGSQFEGFPNFVLSPPADYDKELAKQSIDLIKAMNPKRVCFTHLGPYALDGHYDYYDALKNKHELWCECVWEIARKNPQADPEKVFELFLEKNKELESYPTQRFSFRLSVKGILIYLKRTGKLSDH